MMAESRRDRAAARASGELELARLEERRAHQRQVAAALSGGVGGGGQSPTSSASASELETVSSQRSAPTIAELTDWLPPRESSSGGVVDVRGGGSGHSSSASGQALSDALSKVSAQQQGQANNPQVSPVTFISISLFFFCCTHHLYHHPPLRYIVEPIWIYDNFRYSPIVLRAFCSSRNRTDRLTTQGKRAVLGPVFVPVLIISGTLAPPCARASSFLCGTPSYDPPRNGGVDEARRV
jgi:hypothetical protein